MKMKFLSALTFGAVALTTSAQAFTFGWVGCKATCIRQRASNHQKTWEQKGALGRIGAKCWNDCSIGDLGSYVGVWLQKVPYNQFDDFLDIDQVKNFIKKHTMPRNFNPQDVSNSQARINQWNNAHKMFDQLVGYMDKAYEALKKVQQNDISKRNRLIQLIQKVGDFGAAMDMDVYARSKASLAEINAMTNAAASVGSGYYQAPVAQPAAPQPDLNIIRQYGEDEGVDAAAKSQAMVPYNPQMAQMQKMDPAQMQQMMQMMQMFQMMQNNPQMMQQMMGQGAGASQKNPWTLQPNFAPGAEAAS